MPALFIYLIKVNVALLIFCLGYYAVLRHLTFYTLNRIYLVTAIVFSTLYPKVDLTAFLNRHEKIQVVVLNWQDPAKALTPSTVHDVWYWMQVVFWIGVVVFAVRLLTQLLSLYRLHKRSEPMQLRHYMIRVIKGDINPFSFWRSIYINPENHSPNELDAILEHEQIHVNEWHTLDILLGEISAIFYWFNPGIWLMKRAIRENIEFITDRKILQKGVDSKAYQYSLLNVNFGAQGNAIVNHFNISTIKKRIIMMNAKRSSTVNITRYVFLIPVVMVLLLVFSVSKAELSKSMNKGSASVMRVLKAAATKMNLAAEKNTNIPPDRKATSVLTAVSSFIIQHDTLPKIAGKIAAIDTNKKLSITLDNLTGRGEPDIFVDGVKFTTGLNTIDPNTIFSISVIKDMAATSPNGTIYIVTKGHENKVDRVYLNTDTIKGNGKLTRVMVTGRAAHPPITTVRINGFSYQTSDMKKTVVNGDTVYSTLSVIGKNSAKADAMIAGMTGPQTIMLFKDTAFAGEPTKVTVNARRAGSVSLHSLSSSASSGSQALTILPAPINFTDKLIIINGKIASEKELKKISADKIESISNLSGDAATRTYGDKAKAGAVLIITKK